MQTFRPSPVAIVKRVHRDVPSRPAHHLDACGLVCVFRPYERLPLAGGDVRIVRDKRVCGRSAPRRRTGDRKFPRHPNRFGEPLCFSHRIYADDLYVFPDEPGALGAARTRSERTEAVERRVEAFMRLMKGGPL